MFNRRRILISQSQKKLPYGFSECNYLGTTGTQYIDLGICPTATKIDLRIVLYKGEQAAQEQCFFDIRKNGNSSMEIGFTRSVLFAFASGKGSLTFYGNERIGNVIEVHSVFEANSRTATFSYNGNSVSYTDSATINDPDGKSISLFKVAGGLAPATGRIYKLTLKFDNNTVYNLIPCLDDNNVPCMYDTVSKRAFYNNGTGDFYYQLKGAQE